MNTENYSVYFWESLQANNDLFGQNLASQISEFLSEKDFSSVRDLYKKIKEILSRENTERIFGFSDTNQLLELHDFLDETFELLLTDNEATDRIFKDATKKRTQASASLQQSGPSQSQQSQFNYYQEVKLLSKPVVINLRKTTSSITKEKQSHGALQEDDEDYLLPQKKRVLKRLKKEHFLRKKNAYRPFDYESI